MVREGPDRWLTARLCHMLRAGAPLDLACLQLGIDRASFDDWIERGSDFDPDLDDPEDEDPYTHFLIRVHEALFERNGPIEPRRTALEPIVGHADRGTVLDQRPSKTVRSVQAERSDPTIGVSGRKYPVRDEFLLEPPLATRVVLIAPTEWPSSDHAVWVYDPGSNPDASETHRDEPVEPTCVMDLEEATGMRSDPEPVSGPPITTGGWVLMAVLVLLIAPPVIIGMIAWSIVLGAIGAIRRIVGAFGWLGRTWASGLAMLRGRRLVLEVSGRFAGPNGRISSRVEIDRYVRTLGRIALESRALPQLE